MTRYRFAWCWFIGCCLLAALPAAGQAGTEEEPIVAQVVEEEAVEEEPARWSMAGWCVLRGEREQAPEQPAEGPSEDAGDQAAEDQEELVSVFGRR